MNSNLSNSRQAALACLTRWHEGRAFAETLVDRECSRLSLSPADRHLVQALVFGVLRNQSWLDHVIGTLRQGRLDMNVRLILQLGLCQLFLLGMADHAAVYETVNLAPSRLRGLVNAILRNALRKEKAILAEREKLPLHILYSTPRWLVEKWTAQFGPEAARKLLQWNNTTPRLYVRANSLIPLNDPPEGLVPLGGAPGWFSVEGLLPLKDVNSGALYVADPSTRGKARLTATDLHEHRLPVLRENLARYGSPSVATAQADWTQPCPPQWEKRFDAVLLDVPCSNTGVIQRRVDVRWRLNPEEIRRLAALQRTILENASRAVRPGGRLVYSTCSIDAEEDGLLVREFLKDHPEWTLKEEKLVLPQEEKSDGAYAALLICA